MDKFIEFVVKYGETYNLNMKLIGEVLTPNEMEDLGKRGTKYMHHFFSCEWGELFDQRWSNF